MTDLPCHCVFTSIFCAPASNEIPLSCVGYKCLLSLSWSLVRGSTYFFDLYLLLASLSITYSTRPSVTIIGACGKFGSPYSLLHIGLLLPSIRLKLSSCHLYLWSICTVASLGGEMTPIDLHNGLPTDKQNTAKMKNSCIEYISKVVSCHIALFVLNSLMCHKVMNTYTVLIICYQSLDTQWLTIFFSG